MDYRDIPKTKYNAISCLEMAEHVGVRLFKTFARQVYDLLEDDGLFVIQVTGLRRSAQMEDLVWGLFMAKYIFPGADASTPLGFYIDQLEKAGWDIRSVDSIGIHYCLTIRAWYRNWLENKETILNTYGARWYRIWELFLAWSCLIGPQGTANCYQILANKNINTFDRYEAYVPNHEEKTNFQNEDSLSDPPRDFFW
jgi:cyclopropane fatty-acyl-phospholipid synthase-like methyltransferase